MAFCTKCGASIADGVKFCESCGAAVEVTPVAQPVESIPVAQPVEAIPVAQPVAQPVNAQPASVPVPVQQPNWNDQATYAQATYAAQSVEPPAHGMAVASLVLGIIGLLCCGICAPIALGLAISAQNKGNQEGIRKAGFILGCIGVALWVIGILVAVVGSM